MALRPFAFGQEGRLNVAPDTDWGQYDKVTQASMNSLYVKARELDRGQNEREAPFAFAPGVTPDRETHASAHASDVESHASTHATDADRYV